MTGLLPALAVAAISLYEERPIHRIRLLMPSPSKHASAHFTDGDAAIKKQVNLRGLVENAVGT